MIRQSFDVIVVGAGIAGAGVAAELSAELRVAVLEQEPQPGYHTTGRSAAVFAESYGGEAVRALSRASRPFLTAPPPGFTATELLTPRGFLFLAREDQQEALEALAAQPDMRNTARRVSAQEALALSPLLRPGYAQAALFDPNASDIEVHALHHGYLRVLRGNSGAVLCDARVAAAQRSVEGWQVSTPAGMFAAPLLVNAAGAWADRLAGLAGVAPIGLQPMRRTAALVDVPAAPDMARWPLTIDIDEEFYFKPDAGRLLISPGDETPIEPCDAAVDDMDLAIAVDRIERATVLNVRRVHSQWAGLRSFVPDRVPVAGFAPGAPGFFWLAAQGGYGIQTAPALSRFAAAQILGRPVPADLLEAGLDPLSLSPARTAVQGGA